MDAQVIVAVFAVIGAGLKYIDEAFDEETFSRRSATYLAGVILALWVGLSLLDSSSGTILLSILLGVLLTGKIDNKVFGLSTAGIFGSFVFLQKVLMLPLLFLSAAGVIDEKGNDYVDSHRSNRILQFFFLHRFTMKIGVSLLCLSGVFAWHYLVAFLLFDASYDAVGIISQAHKEEMALENKHASEDVPTAHVA